MAISSSSSAFWDTSALLPLCLPEKQSGPARRVLRNGTPVVWWTTRVEVASGIARVHREGSLRPPAIAAALVRLESLRAVWREVPPSEHLLDLAFVLLSRFPLRAADSMQLAAALVWCKERPARRSFICADVRLSEAAEQAGFSVERL